MKNEPAPSMILQFAAGVAFFIINLFALALLLRGHNLPGGGFIAGLVTAISLLLINLAYGLEKTHRILRVDPARLAFIGLAVALLAGMFNVLRGGVFLEQSNWHLHHVPVFGDVHVGTPLIFDIGVFLVVVGICCKMLFVLAQSTSGMPALVAKEAEIYSSPLEEPVEGDALGEEKE